MRLKWPFAGKKYEIRRNFAHGGLIIEEAALRDLVERYWGRIKGVILRDTRFIENEGGLLVEITLRVKEKPAPEMIKERSAVIKQIIETCCILPVDDVCVHIEEPR
jgi:hypothetical protein